MVEGLALERLGKRVDWRIREAERRRAMVAVREEEMRTCWVGEVSLVSVNGEEEKGMGRGERGMGMGVGK